jgi:Tfp pilus assembly protein PilX
VIRRPDQRGIALILSLIVLLTLSGLALAFLSVSALEPAIARNLADGARARWLAEAGLEIGYATLVAATDAEDSWSALLEGATGRDPWVALPGLATARLPGLRHPEGTYTVVIRNDAETTDAAVTGQPADADAARDANGVVVLRSTGFSNAAVRTVEVVVKRRRTPGRPAAGVRALHTVSNWRER